MPKYNQPKGHRCKKGTIKREDGGRAPIFLWITVEGYWWCYTNKMWVKSISKDCPEPVDSIWHAASDYGSIRSVKAAQRHIRNHPEIEKVLKYIERSFTDPAFQPSADEELVIVERFKSPEQYVGVSDVFEAITQFANALTAKGRESFTPMELQLTLFTLIADVVTDKDVVEVVRCEDCKYRSMESGEFDGLEPACRFWTDAGAIYPVFVDMNGFCSEGELKDGGESDD